MGDKLRLSPNGTAVASTWTQTKTISGRTTNDSATGVINRTYAYDGANRLTAASDGGGSRLYAYDRNTNRCGLAATCDGQWTVDQADRLQASPQASTYTYDWRGNLTASTPRPGKTSATQILYDGWDHARLLNDGTTTATTTLDPTGRALRRRVTRNSDSVLLEDTTYGYAGPGDTPAWNRPTGGTTYTTHLGGGATDTAGTPTWPLANPHGDLIGATDTNGTFSFQVLADEFGNGPVNTDRNGWLGTHERTVDHTTLGWYRMGVRLYDPTTARFNSVDPIEGGSANDYDYVEADPINRQDLEGTYSYSLTWTIGNGRGAERLMRWMKIFPDDFFPFSVPGQIQLGRTIHLSGQYDIGDVIVSGMGSNWFSFRTLGGHVEGKNATVMFQIYQRRGKVYLRIDAAGPDGRAQTCWALCRPIRGGSNALRKFVARDLWSHMALNLRREYSAYYGYYNA